MATSIRRSPLIAPRSSKAYRLEMEGRTLVLLLSMMALTGIVIFSLGVVTGMGMRVPAGAIPVAIQAPLPAEREEEAVPKREELVFNEGLKGGGATIEGLKINEANAARQTKSLLKRAERELKLEEVTAKSGPKPPPASSNRPAAGKPPPRSAVVAASKTPPSRQGRFTVQVFSSQHRKNARDLMLRLKKLGFEAYMNQFQAADQRTWFRVRVGRTSRPEAERLVERLRGKAKMKAPRIVQL